MGNVEFESGKLTYASKVWYDGRVAESDYALAEALQDVFTQMKARGETVAKIKTRTIRSAIDCRMGEKNNQKTLERNRRAGATTTCEELAKLAGAAHDTIH